MTTRLEPVAWRVRWIDKRRGQTPRAPMVTFDRKLADQWEWSGYEVQPLAVIPAQEEAPAPEGMRDDVLERLRALDFGGHYHEARFQQIADDILAIIAKGEGRE